MGIYITGFNLHIQIVFLRKERVGERRKRAKLKGKNQHVYIRMAIIG
jgi:hypothetical protein